jgi:hypothetical protein
MQHKHEYEHVHGHGQRHDKRNGPSFEKIIAAIKVTDLILKNFKAMIKIYCHNKRNGPSFNKINATLKATDIILTNLRV